MIENLPKPELDSPTTRAWRYDIAALAAKNDHPTAGVSSWLIEAKWAHPIWHSYALHCYHLRDVPSLGHPVIYLPGATHELILFALDPDKPRDLADFPAHLHPPNFAAQFVAEDDEAAALLVAAAVDEIVEGKLSPATDFRRQWVERFGDNMLADRDNIRKVQCTADGHTHVTVIKPAPKPPSRL